MSSRTNTPSRALLLALCGFCGCFDDCGGSSYDPTPGPGELGKGEFHYFCVSADDPACPEGEDSGPFPARFALGGDFRLSYTWTGDVSRPLPDLRSASAERLRVEDELVTPLALGYTAVLALVGNSEVGDLIHLLAAAPAELVLQRDRIDLFELVLAIDEEATVRAITLDEGDYILAGTLVFAFEIDDPTIATVVGTTAGSLLVRGVGPGSTTLRATLGPLSLELPLTVAGLDPTTGGTSEGTTGDTGGSTTSGSSSSTGGVL